MKFLKTFLFVLTLSIFSSCDNEPIDAALNSQINNPNNPTDPNVPNAGIFKADFDGQTFQTSNVECVIANGILLMDATRLPQDDSFSFVINQPAVGNFSANDNLLIYQLNSSEYGYWTLNLNDPSENLGSVTITSIDAVNKKISGTFNFKGYWSNDSVTIAPKNFTNGSFTNISYSTEIPPNTDTFSANINGAIFSNPTIAVVTTTIGTDDFISITGNRTNDKINISIKESVGVGNYVITGTTTDQVKASYQMTAPVYNQNATIGLVTITQKTATRIKGTFNFTTPNTPIPFIINSGNFDVEY